MLRRTPAVLSTVALGAALLSGCIEQEDRFPQAAPPASAVPSQVASAVGTDVGQFYVTPRKDLPKAQLDDTLGKVRALPYVQQADPEPDGRINVELRAETTKEQREELLKQLAAIGTVEEGI